MLEARPLHVHPRAVGQAQLCMAKVWVGVGGHEQAGAEGRVKVVGRGRGEKPCGPYQSEKN